MFKSFTRVVCTAARISSGTATASSSRGLEQLLRPALCAPSSLTYRPFTRSIWMLCSSGSSSGHRPGLLSSNQGIPSLSCGCGGLHTEGDKAFVEFLSDEIKEERKIQKHKSLPKMSGDWELELSGTEAKLSRKTSGEKVTITFNVNNSIPPTFEEEAQQGEKPSETEPDILSSPNFVVEVTKQAATQSLVFDCHYPEDEVAHGEEEEEESDIFAIREVSFQPTGESDWKDTSYTLNTDSLDWALYDHLMDFLADRGVDNTFADELVELSTALEHQEYIKFLEELSGFVKCQ
ncbi:complement component 1 Q subcomponent-binding protein, mitochondrial-like [Acipenser oxyrinchus oxyrinchus]|uniref:Complement component 1 Q subcomponent-binding protein, mitochondrial n=1 Tax=Acipenser oxyrinchus oxyrinchus TaxID=40147 RepID=A0AAD8CWK6_ACIOX|nr:complement component 1 Q subcomponent-binding protein, mitochondrial-like [Acipenser oxyrinchus oxyrinchus]